MTTGIHTVIYPVKDLERAKALFTALSGAEPTTDAPHFAGYSVNGQDVGLVPNGHEQGLTGPVPYWHVADLRATLQTLVDGGAVLRDDVRDVGEGKLIATVTDADGNIIGILQPVA